MNSKITASICMATYNGGQYLRDQLDSIINQINSDDEIIIIDDCSSDDTMEILSSYASENIYVYKNSSNLGHVKSFEKAISLSSKDVIFLSDQDDIWKNSKVEDFKSTFLEHKNVSVITSNMEYMDSEGKIIDYKDFKIESKNSYKFRKNILSIFKGTSLYYGSTMAFRKEIKQFFLPFPKYIESHDLWLGILGNLMKCNFFLEEITIKRRIHSNNVTNKNRGLRKKILSRILFLRNIIEAKRRIIRINKQSKSKIKRY